MLPQLVYDLTNQMQEYQLDVEALIVGRDDRTSAHIFHIDRTGIKTYQHDINFAAIGIGAEHAKSQFMFSRLSLSRQDRFMKCSGSEARPRVA
jgi:hypothetical protein